MRMLDIRERATQIKWQTLAKYLTIVDLRRISSYILTVQWYSIWIEHTVQTSYIEKEYALRIP